MQYTTRRVLNKIVIETSSNESVIKEGGANHFKGVEGVGGKLVLTDKRLIFKSHKFNIQNHQDAIPLAEVKKLEATNTLTLELTNRDKHKFIVDEPTDWIEKIINQKRLVN